MSAEGGRGEVKKKRRVKVNVWGNVKGYEGTRKVAEFPLNTTDREIQEWINHETPTASGEERAGK